MVGAKDRIARLRLGHDDPKLAQEAFDTRQYEAAGVRQLVDRRVFDECKRQDRQEFRVHIAGQPGGCCSVLHTAIRAARAE